MIAFAERLRLDPAVRPAPEPVAPPITSPQLVDVSDPRRADPQPLAYVHAAAGQPDSARVILARAKVRPFEPFAIAWVFIALGETDSAFAWLERSNWQWPHRAVLADPVLDPLRGDARFAELSERVEHEMGLR